MYKSRFTKRNNRVTTIPTYEMDESLEIIFTTMLNQDDMAGAIEFINSVDCHYIPQSSIIRTIIYQILMKCRDIHALVETELYLTNLLEVYPPDDETRRKYYYNSLCDTRGINSELWPVFCHIMNSCLCNYGIYKGGEEKGQQFIRVPNCYFVLDFYVRVIVKDFEYLTSEKEIKISYKDLLIVKLLWPKSEIGAAKSHTEVLLKWINDVYISCQVPKKSEILNCLHKLLTLMVKCVVNLKHELSDIAAVNSSCLAEIVDDIMHRCKDVCSSISNVKLFMISLSLKYLQLKICEKIVAKMISPTSRTLFVPLTLRNIVNYYMVKSKKGKGLAGKIASLKQRQAKGSLPNRAVKAQKGDTALHEYARNNKFADLLMELNEYKDDVNAKNDCGFTPLHEACIANSFMCAKILLTETGKGNIPKIDLYATSKEGLTALHYAVNANAVDIVKMMLIHGGSTTATKEINTTKKHRCAHFLNAVDPKGRKPADLSISLEMDNILEKFIESAGEQDNSNDGYGQGQMPQEAPSFQFFKDYGIYLHTLTCLLSAYSDVYHLYDLVFLKCTNVKNHEKNLCCHYTSEMKSEYSACSDDASLIKEMPALIDNFVKSIKKTATEKKLNIDIELIPLKTYSSSLIM